MTDGGCDHAGEAAGWVLGTLPADEAERFAGQLETCQACREQVARLRAGVDVLAEAAPPATPPADLRGRIMAAVEEEAALFRAADEVADRTAAPRRPHRPSRTLLLGGSAAALLAVGLVSGALLGDRRADDPRPRAAPARTVIGEVTEDGGGPRARAVVVIRGGAAQLTLSNLAPPPQDRVYQAWVVRSGSPPEPTGALFSVPRSGDTRIALPSLRGTERVIVTAEPPRGSRAPTPPPRVVVRFSR
ncbi:MAG: anti-sigma factor [Actinomycetota bacterium]|nr:anti-sigma factor [Actinomycetota bacterium]